MPAAGNPLQMHLLNCTAGKINCAIDTVDFKTQFLTRNTVYILYIYIYALERPARAPNRGVQIRLSARLGRRDRGPIRAQAKPRHIPHPTESRNGPKSVVQNLPSHLNCLVTESVFLSSDLCTDFDIQAYLWSPGAKQLHIVVTF